MKKNLISILILALLVVNLVLTSIMMFSVLGSVKQTSALVTNIASILNIELTAKEEEKDTTVLIANIVSYDIKDMTIPLKRAENEEKTSYFVTNVTLMMNSANEDYETYSETVASNDSILRALIVDVISSHTLDEMQNNQEAIKAEILKKIQDIYNSDFIYQIAFSSQLFG